jgi:hypothetical protein
MLATLWQVSNPAGAENLPAGQKIFTCATGPLAGNLPRQLMKM